MKIGFFITARLKSTRLKRKIVLDLNGKTVLDRVIERCKSTEGIDNVVLCTSSNPQDSELYKYALKHGIEFYIGSEDDVLRRNLDAAKYHNCDAFASTTADNPLFCIRAIEQVIEYYKREAFDFGFIHNLPIGCMPYFLRTKALKVACFMKSETDTEIWGPFVRRPDFFHIADFPIGNSPFGAFRRLTCDYLEDLEILRAIYSHFTKEEVPTLTSVFQVLKENPDLWSINEKCNQIWPDEDDLKRIRIAFDSQIRRGKQYAREQGIEIVPKLSKIDIAI